MSVGGTVRPSAFAVSELGAVSKQEEGKVDSADELRSWTRKPPPRDCATVFMIIFYVGHARRACAPIWTCSASFARGNVVLPAAKDLDAIKAHRITTQLEALRRYQTGGGFAGKLLSSDSPAPSPPSARDGCLFSHPSKGGLMPLDP
jgi:hypothetical protein